MVEEAIFSNTGRTAVVVGARLSVTSRRAEPAWLATAGRRMSGLVRKEHLFRLGVGEAAEDSHDDQRILAVERFA